MEHWEKISNRSNSSLKQWHWGLLFGILSFFILLFAKIIYWLNPPLPKCFFKVYTGYPCITCGTTRTLIDITNFEFGHALLMNPLVFLTTMGLGFFIFYSIGICLLKFPEFNLSYFKKWNKIIRYNIILAIIFNWIYLIIIHR